jgi:P-type Mg2+ transporter
VLLLFLALFAGLTGDTRAAAVMLLMVGIGVSLRFVQEARATSAAAQLRAMIRVTATAVRDGQAGEVPISQLVPGDRVELSAGDMIPADVRLVADKDLFVTQAMLTGEAFPTEKHATATPAAHASPLEWENTCFLGTSVESGTGTAVVVATGLDTALGNLSRALVGAPPPTSFDRGVRRFTWLMIGFIVVMGPLVFLINGLTKGDWLQSLAFALAVAVGLTPEMLPMVVAVCLTNGALALSRERVIVKRMNSIQNLGAMDVLCTDKTGTLTMDQIILEKYCNLMLESDPEVLKLAYLNSHFQTGLKSVMDRAILRHTELHEPLCLADCTKVDEIPFDFSRKIMSVVVRTPENTCRLICKGAPDEVFRRCGTFYLDGERDAIEPMIAADLREEFEELGADGFRVLAIAYRDLPEKPAYSKEDECDLVLRGYVAFLDPPKDSARVAITELQEHGVRVKVLTGDNELVTRKICRDVGLQADPLLLGGDVEKLSDAQLAAVAPGTAVFARLSPHHKSRIIQALQHAGHVVGFLGDGINDAPALRAADVGISVDTAVDIAKESADAILLEKDLHVLCDGVMGGRRVFVNILKYIRMGASSSFGNMLSVVGASVFLPFVPMAPIQILTNNLLYDLSQLPIPTDDVDPEQIARPRPWSIQSITRFILFIGPCSSIFDYATFFMLLYALGCWDPANVALFQTGWFVESLVTQTLIIHVIRTNRLPFLQSRASWPLMATTACVMAVGMWLPQSPFSDALEFTNLPGLYWALLPAILVGYVVLTQAVKMWLWRRGWLGE